MGSKYKAMKLGENNGCCLHALVKMKGSGDAFSLFNQVKNENDRMREDPARNLVVISHGRYPLSYYWNNEKGKAWFKPWNNTAVYYYNRHGTYITTDEIMTKINGLQNETSNAEYRKKYTKTRSGLIVTKNYKLGYEDDDKEDILSFIQDSPPTFQCSYLVPCPRGSRFTFTTQDVFDVIQDQGGQYPGGIHFFHCRALTRMTDCFHYIKK